MRPVQTWPAAAPDLPLRQPARLAGWLALWAVVAGLHGAILAWAVGRVQAPTRALVTPAAVVVLPAAGGAATGAEPAISAKRAEPAVVAKRAEPTVAAGRVGGHIAWAADSSQGLAGARPAAPPTTPPTTPSTAAVHSSRVGLDTALGAAPALRGRHASAATGSAAAAAAAAESAMTTAAPASMAPQPAAAALAAQPGPSAVALTAQPGPSAVAEASQPPRPLASNPLPIYPEAAREDGLQGTVRLRLSVDAQGRVQATEWVSRSGSNLLDRAAREALRQWRFEPARAAGQAVAGQLTLSLQFRLDGPVTWLAQAGGAGR